MSLAQYGITLPITLLLLSLGVISGKLWQKTLSSGIYGDKKHLTLHKSLSILLLFVAALVGTYFLVGAVLTCFVYAALTCGILGEWSGELLRLLILHTSKNFHKPLPEVTIDTNLHTLPEAVKLSH